ncbi:putative serine/threonine-protein kinase-like protein CCR3 [Hordeum vulgare subsp. vulgare]|uniref:Protein kinase domain-containing protein n=1 Tax=Hordeum vulgare subsp. vulgare TaxID=112509 RepID=A0A8I6W932_HORVV|nr:putative serine/threonine-protein kinase-like protein CCR3 [Hordeum vulgare subsp. vulgare]
MIVQATITARQNKTECEQLARRVLMIAQLLPHVQEPEAVQPLAGLGDTLRDAHELVMSCQVRSAAYRLVMAGRTAERFREVQSKIDSYLILFPVISHIGITRRLERIYNVLVPDASTTGEPPRPVPQLQEFTEVVAGQEVLLPHGTHEFTLSEIVAATNNFASDTKIGQGASGTVYRGRLHDGQQVAVKCMWTKQLKSHYGVEEEFHTELDILSRLRHKHIIRLLGSYFSKDSPQKKRNGLLTRWRKETEEPEKLIVYEYMENGTLFHHLHPDQSSISPSPVTTSWKMRLDVLLGVSRAIEHLHCHHAHMPIIHRDITTSNILLDAIWVARVSDFGLSATWDMASDETGFDAPYMAATLGYMAPETACSFRVKPVTDVYSLGVVMLEVLTGRKAFEQGNRYYFAEFASRVIKAGNIEEWLDRRPEPEPMPWQLQALKRVARTARHCVKLDIKDRPAISDIVANLEMAYELFCRDESGSVDELPDSPASPRDRSVFSVDYQPDQEPEVLDKGR